MIDRSPPSGHDHWRGPYVGVIVSEHAATAGTAVGILTAFFPKEEANLKATAAELGQTWLLMGTNYRSDIGAGRALGQAAAQKALARTATAGLRLGGVPAGAGAAEAAEP